MIEVAACWLPLPPTSNNSYVNAAGQGRVKSKALRAWQDEAGWTWKATGRMPEHALDTRQTWGWSGAFWFPTPARADLDNHSKHVADLIVAVVFGGKPDDRYLIWQEHRKKVSATCPGVLVRVYEVDRGELDA